MDEAADRIEKLEAENARLLIKVRTLHNALANAFEYAIEAVNEGGYKGEILERAKRDLDRMETALGLPLLAPPSPTIGVTK